jgi:hypothetical protein
MSARRLAWGAPFIGIYVIVAVLLAGHGPVLPLYDAGPIAPQPYRWVDPPPEFEAENVAPEGTRQEVAMTDVGTVASSIVTPDGQAAFVLREGSFPTRLGEIAVMVDIRPADPTKIGEPPRGTRYDGNAYTITATYAKDGSTAELANPATVVLRSPLGGTRLLRLEPATGWTEINDATPVAASLQVFGETTKLGTFVAAQTDHGGGFPTLTVSLVASGAAIVAAWFVAAHTRAWKLQLPRRDRRAAAKTAGPTKAKTKNQQARKRRR